MKGKWILFGLAAAGAVTLGLAQKKQPRPSTLMAGQAAVAVVNKAGKVICQQILAKTAAALILVTATQWLCGKSFEK